MQDQTNQRPSDDDPEPIRSEPEARLLDEAKDGLADIVHARKDGIADGLAGLADTVQRAGSRFEGQQEWLARAVGQGADEIQLLAETLRKKDLQEIIGDVRGFAERQPALFIGVSLAAGFAAARFFKLAAADLSRDDLPAVAVAHRD